MSIIRRELVVQLTDAEMKDLAKQLADTNQRAARIEAEKKSRMSAYKAESDKCEAEIEAISLKITSGTELRTIECEVRYHDPRERYKTVYRLDSGEPVGSPELMSAEELQDLFINALGEQGDFFVFRDHSRVDLLPRESIDEESGLHQGVVGPILPEDMVDEPHVEKDMIFMVTLELANNDGKKLYSLWKTSATRQIPASSDGTEITDAETTEADQEQAETQRLRNMWDRNACKLSDLGITPIQCHIDDKTILTYNEPYEWNHEEFPNKAETKRAYMKMLKAGCVDVNSPAYAPDNTKLPFWDEGVRLFRPSYSEAVDTTEVRCREKFESGWSLHGRSKGDYRKLGTEANSDWETIINNPLNLEA